MSRYHLTQLAYAVLLSLAGLAYGARLLLRAVDQATTWPSAA